MNSKQKRVKALLLVVLSLLLMALTIPAAIWLTHTQTAQVGNEELRCRSLHQTAHIIVIAKNQTTPEHIKAERCDTLTITNRDAQTRLIGFGPHDHHISYDGISERLLGHNQSLTITLIKPGNYAYHDHAHQEVQGSFTVL